MIRESAFSLIDDLDRSRTTSDVLKSVKRTLSAFGLQYFCFSLFPGPQQTFNEVILESYVPPAWMDLYLSEHFSDDDAALRHVRSVSHPFKYVQAPYDEDKNPRARLIMEAAHQFGLSGGVMVPISNAAGSVGMVWMDGDRPDFRDQDMPALHLIALYAFERINRLAKPPIRNMIAFTKREKEILRWLSEGKTSVRIGEILHLSERTVDWHVSNLMKKLSASNRTHAVALARSITLND